MEKSEGGFLTSGTLGRIIDRKAIENLYRMAQPCMEMVRKLEPENKERWGKHLYRIYMFLNRGKEFDEIDKLLRSN